MGLRGFHFAPRIRDLVDTRVYIPKSYTTDNALKPGANPDPLL
ncbi:hypothetical protein [Pseudomonas sp. JAI115]